MRRAGKNSPLQKGGFMPTRFPVQHILKGLNTMYKFNGFTEKANKAINLAIEKAETMGHTYIGASICFSAFLPKARVRPPHCFRPTG